MFLDCIGWIGLGCCAIAYLLLNIGYMRFDRWPFQLLNLLGGVGLAIKAYQLHDLPNMLANVLWGLIAVVGIVKYLLNKRDQESPSKL